MTKYDWFKLVIAMVLSSLALGAVLFFAADALLWPKREPASPSPEIAAPAPPAAAPIPVVSKADSSSLFTYTANTLPSIEDHWTKKYEQYEAISARIENGALHIADRDTADRSAIQYTREWSELPGFMNVAEFEVKVVSVGGIATAFYPSGYGGIYIGTSDGTHHMVYTLYPDRILSSSYVHDASTGRSPYILGKTYAVDTTGRFNTFRAIIENGVAKLYMNNVLVLQQAAGTGIYNVNGVEFGAGSSDATGEAYFRAVRAFRIPVQSSKRDDPAGS